MFAIADCNNFFVSCERVFRPDLEGKPVMVLSGNDGCVIARSNEVKALGIKMGAPLYQVKDLVSQHQISLFSSNFSLYGDLSARVMNILSGYTIQLEQYSIDEAFLYFPDSMGIDAIRQRCRDALLTVRRGVGIPISIGIAPTRTLAKLASRFAKKYSGYHGVCVIADDLQRLKALELTGVGDIWGIGRKSRAKLQLYGVNTARQLAEKDESFVRQLMNKPGVMTWRELRGESCIVVAEPPEKQSITRSRTFASPLNDIDDMQKYVADFCDSCARKLRKQHSVCRQMIVYAQSSRFRPDERQAIIRALVQLPVPTSNGAELTAAAMRSVRAQFVVGGDYKSAGVILLDIAPDSGVQQSLFDERDRLKDQKLQSAIDHINDTLGKNTVKLAVRLNTEHENKYFHSQHLSPLYTTDINQIFTIKV